MLMKLITHLCLVPRFRMCGVTFLLPIYTFMACTLTPLLCTLMLKYFTIKYHIKRATTETLTVKPNLTRSTDGL